MRFSILVPVYNVQDYLEECLDSIYSQKFCDFEVIMINDGSDDESGEICDRYKNRFPNKTLVRHKQNEGLLMARREALSLASGEYIIFCDSDDLLEENALNILNNKIIKFSPDIIQYDLYTFLNRDVSYNINQNRYFVDNDKLYNDVSILQKTLLERSYNIWSMAGKCVKRSLYDIEVNYTKYKHIQYGEDSIQSVALYLAAKNFIYINERIYLYRSFSGMTKKLQKKYCDDFFEIGNYLYKKKREFLVKDIEDKILIFFMNIIYELLLNVSMNEYTFLEFKEIMRYVNSKTEFAKRFRQYKNGKKIFFANKKLSILMTLVYHRQYLILHQLLRIRNKVKCK